MIECTCVTSVYYESVPYAPDEQLSLPEAIAADLIERGAVAEVMIAKSKVKELKSEAK